VSITKSFFKESNMSTFTISRLSIAALLPLLAMPSVSSADSTAATDACIQAFLSSDFAKERKVTVEKDSEPTFQPRNQSGLYTIEVVAKGRQSGKQVAHMVCEANTKGTIIALNGSPTSALVMPRTIR
jgi:hypothetical protein